MDKNLWNHLLRNKQVGHLLLLGKNLDQLFADASAAQAAGRLEKAQVLCKVLISRLARRAALVRRSDPTFLWRCSDLMSACLCWDEAKQIYGWFLVEGPDNPISALYSGLSLERLGRADEALESFEASVARWPLDPSLLGHYFRICVEHDLAARFLEFVQSNAPSDAILVVIDQANPVLLWSLSDLLSVQGRTEEEARLYERLSRELPDNPRLALWCALSFERRREVHEAISSLETSLARWPDDESLLEHYFRLCMESDQAERFFGLTQRIRLVDAIDLVIHKCENLGWLWSLADLLSAHGRWADANDIYQRLASRLPSDALSCLYQALALERLQQYDQAATALEVAIIDHPLEQSLKTHLFRMCIRWFELSRFLKAVRMTSAAEVPVRLNLPDYYQMMVETGGLDSIIATFRDIHRQVVEEDFIQIKNRILLTVEQEVFTFAQIKQTIFLCKLLAVDTGFVHQLYSIFTTKLQTLCLQFAGEEHDALMVTRLIAELTPPVIPESTHAQVIDEFIDACLQLTVDSRALTDPIRDMPRDWAPWHSLFSTSVPDDLASYHTAVSAFERLAVELWPGLDHVAKHVRTDAYSPRADNRIRVGFMMPDTMPMLSGFCTQLSHDKYEVIFLRPGEKGQSRQANEWTSRAQRVVEFSALDATEAIQTIASAELDIIISGPTTATIFCPLIARLAHLQMVLLEPNWTDGLTNSDYYISWRDAEPQTPENFYKSKVALLNNPPYWIERNPTQSICAQERVDVRQRLFGSWANDHIYLCANDPIKVHYQMDDMFAKLLERDPSARIVFLRAEHPPTKTLKHRLQRSLGDRSDRLIFLPRLEQSLAQKLLLSVDCCLDSFPISGMSSSFDASMLGVPLVTLSTPIPFGRWTASLYERMGVTELIASDCDDYVRLAMELASNESWRSALGAKIKERSAWFVENPESVRDLELFLDAAWQRHQTGLRPENWISGEWVPRA